MAKVLIQIEDQGDELVFQAAIDPPLTEDKAVFSTAELVGLYLREHMTQVLDAAVAWAKTPDTVEEAQIKAPSLILPPDMLGQRPIIPDIPEILAMLNRDEITSAQAEAWIRSHIAASEDVGMLRDVFGGLAMLGLVSGTDPEHSINLNGAAEWSYNMADAMLKARTK